MYSSTVPHILGVHSFSRGRLVFDCAFVGLTLRVKLCGRGLRAEADAARRLPHVSRSAAGGVPPHALVS